MYRRRNAQRTNPSTPFGRIPTKEVHMDFKTIEAKIEITDKKLQEVKSLLV